MATVQDQILNANLAISSTIEFYPDRRDLMSQAILAQLRNLVEGVALLAVNKSLDQEFDYLNNVKPALKAIKGMGRFKFIYHFHDLIQKSGSHYTFDGEGSERLMLKYYENLYKIRHFIHNEYGISILENLEDFPVNLDPSLKEYHEKIAEKINHKTIIPPNEIGERFYIHKTKPFFLDGKVYYEVTFYPAINKVSKFDRIIAFSDIEITDKYAANLVIDTDEINVLDRKMPIMVIRRWHVSIRPCEFNNFAKILGKKIDVKSNSREYAALMNKLTITSDSLISFMDMPDIEYNAIKTECLQGVEITKIFPVLDAARTLIRSSSCGCNVLKYLMLRMNNELLKSQYSSNTCDTLSDLYLKRACKPFDKMPFCTSLAGHNPKFGDVFDSIEITGREAELLSRKIRNNVEQNGVLYTPVDELGLFGNVPALVKGFNDDLFWAHRTRRGIVLDKKHAVISGYEVDTVDIIKKFKEFTSQGILGYGQSVDQWLKQPAHSHLIDDDLKKDALRDLFSHSRLALIYGAAGTGKSTMIDYIAQYFNDKDKLFLAHTNPAIDNLKRKVTAQNSRFRTISYQKNQAEVSCDLLIIDECSTVSNTDLLAILEKVTAKLIVLVGDVYQIESIQFGNWFSIAPAFIPKTSIFELKNPYRTQDGHLLNFWGKVRNIENDIAEVIAHYGYSASLDKSIFDRKQDDEIILCLNYDGLYGINNINRFLQSANSNKSLVWKTSTYKVGDPVLFNDSDRFKPLIYNNLKGWIVDLEREKGWVTFDIKLDREVNSFNVEGYDGLEYVDQSVVRFKVYDYLPSSSDDDDDDVNIYVPFQVAYAVSIHKAQGLEYDSVKVVITDENEDNITHSIFYTAITRTKKDLKIFWTPETQQNILNNLQRVVNPRDIALLSSRNSDVK